MKLVQFDPTSELLTPLTVALTGPTPNAPVVTGSNGLIDATLLPSNLTGGSLSPTQRHVSAQGSVIAGDGSLWADATTAGFALSLPNATTVAGTAYLVKKVDSTNNAVTIYPGLSQTIDGLASVALTSPASYVRVQSDGHNWYITDATGGGSVNRSSSNGIGINEVFYASTLAIDLSIGSVVYIHVDGNVTSTSALNPVDGMQVTMLLAQGGSGNNSFAWPSNFTGTAPIVSGTAQSAANVVCAQTFVYSGPIGLFLATSPLFITTTAPARPTPRVNTVTYASTMTIDLTQGDVVVVPLTGSVASTLAINPRAKQRVAFVLVQDNVGGRTFTYPTNFIGNTNSTAGSPNLLAGTVSIQSFVYVGNLNVFFTATDTIYSSASDLAAITQPTGLEAFRQSVVGLQDVYIPLTTSRASSAFTGAVNGQQIIVVVAQDGTGGHTFNWPGNVVGGGSIQTGSAAVAPNAIASQQFIYLSAYSAWLAMSNMFVR